MVQATKPYNKVYDDYSFVLCPMFSKHQAHAFSISTPFMYLNYSTKIACESISMQFRTWSISHANLRFF
jgi:hypothetical protein